MGYKNPVKQKEWQAKWFQRNKKRLQEKAHSRKAERQEYLRDYNLELKKKVINHYSGGTMICECCHEYIIEFLTIEHPNKDGKQHRLNTKAGGGKNFYLWLIKHNYPNDPPLKVLCYNCNNASYHGICPHKIKKEFKPLHVDMTPL
jgi:hypothetical protein